uniref:Uncharacterized protein n=1 Tax=Mucochytrium quahogii TaxID=96639 RepID=A0A7S2S6H7_9STRA|mmetsp:Transcript_3595/g.5205  ORF Transcript_3595/g.5205 Transcript_3595/m.5205 type:complete len:514 (+) Transcript_3595:285-1826(+)|eukprot:CAMPEP_0203760100 /NCGR_PEP_ID=MMETSP0098-20131031/13470_1 /ASSEMBLY_ACC=CAM_ASM_000208 /TAXON_ID=96639 /ORGANISM=" , Strain NY0313808BC1" /LENGTH=513 /DNA_ID=CAMNT_0050653551 /DNA_START=224 /DNA_END=1765 /DNA_ORIENTATION=+
MNENSMYGEKLISRSPASVGTISPSSELSRSPRDGHGKKREGSLLAKKTRFFQIAAIAFLTFLVLLRFNKVPTDMRKSTTTVWFLRPKQVLKPEEEMTILDETPVRSKQDEEEQQAMAEFLEEADSISTSPEYTALQTNDPRTDKYKIGFERDTYLSDFKNELAENNIDDYEEILRRDIKLLVEEAREQLENISCLPAVCGDPIHLFSTAVPKVVLSSRPGAGNTWVRTLIRNGMRTYTGSVYKDKSLLDGGFKAEYFSRYSNKTGVVKTHFVPQVGLGGKSWAQGAIHLIRAPLDAMLAECQRHYTKHQRGGAHTGSMSDRLVVSKCTRFARFTARRQTYSIYSYEKNSSDGGQGFRDFAGFVRVHFVQNKPTFSIFYEDFIRDIQNALLHLFAVLKYFYRNQMPSVYEATACTLHSLKVAEKFHRKAETPRVFENKATTGPICENLRAYWNVGKWGNCTGVLQKHRTDVTKIQPISIPSDFCDSTIEEKDTVRLDPLFEANTTRKSGDESP